MQSTLLTTASVHPGREVTVVSTLPSGLTTETTTSTSAYALLSEVKYSVVSAATAPLPASIVLTTETTSNEHSIMTAESSAAIAPSLKPVSELHKESVMLPVAMDQPSPLAEQHSAITTTGTEWSSMTVHAVPSSLDTVVTGTFSHPAATTTQATVPCVTTSSSVQPVDTMASSSQPFTVTAQTDMVALSTLSTETAVQPSPSTQASTEPQTETVIPSLPLTSSTTMTTQFTPASSQAQFVGPASPSQTFSVTTTSRTSPVVTSEQGSEPSFTQQLEVTSSTAVPSRLFPEQHEVSSHMKPAVEFSQLSPVPACNEMKSLLDEQADKSSVDAVVAAAESQLLPDEDEKTDVETRDVKVVEYKQDDVTDAQQSSSVRVTDEDEFSVEQAQQNVSERSQLENRSRDSGLSSVAGSVKTAVKVGVLGIIGAPVLAGMAIAKAVRLKGEDGQRSDTAGSVSERDITISQGRFEPDNDDFVKDKNRTIDVTEVQKSVAPSVVPVETVTDSSHVYTDQRYADTQAAFQVQELKPQVPVDVDGNQQKELDTDKEMKDEPEIAAQHLIATDNVGRDIESAGLPGLSLSEALLSRLYDQQHNCFIDPTTGRHISILSSIQSGLIDGNKKMVADLSSGEVISVLEALNRGIIDIETGMVSIDGEASVPLNEALASGLIMDDSDGDLLEMAASIGAAGGHLWNDATDYKELEKSATSEHYQVEQQPRHPLKLIHVLDLGLYDPESGEFQDPQSSDRLSLADAIRCHLLDKNSVVINDPQSEEVLSLEESIRGGLVSGSTSLVHDTSSSENIPLTEALRRGILVPRPMSIATAINIGLYDESNGMFFDPTNGLYFALEEAVESGLIDPHSLVLDPATGKSMAVAAALACGVLDARHGNVVNIHTGEVIPLKQMAVSSQAVLGSQPVGVSSQLSSVADSTDNSGKPQVQMIAESETVVNSDYQLDVASPKRDTPETMKTTDVADAADEVHRRLDDDEDDVCGSADTELTNYVSAPAGDGSQQTELLEDHAVVAGVRQVSVVAEAASVHPTGEVVVSPETGNESYRTPAGDESSELPQETKRQPAADDGLPVNTCTSLNGKQSFTSDESTPVPATTTTVNISHDEFYPPVTARVEDGVKPTSAVDVADSVITLHHTLSSPVSAAVSESSVRVDSPGCAGGVEFQPATSARSLHDAGYVPSDMTQAGAASGQASPDMVHDMVELTQAEFTVVQAPQPLDSQRSRDVQQLEPDPSDAGKSRDDGRDNMSKDDGIKDDLEKVVEVRTDLQPLTNIVEVGVTIGDEVKSVIAREDEGEGEVLKMGGTEHISKNDSQNVVELHRDICQLSDVIQIQAETLPEDTARRDITTKDETKRDDDSEKDSRKKDISDVQKDEQNVTEFHYDVQDVGDATHVAVKPLLEVDVRKDEVREAGLERDVAIKESTGKDVRRIDEEQEVLPDVGKPQFDVMHPSNTVPVEMKTVLTDDERKDNTKEDEAKSEYPSTDNMEKKKCETPEDVVTGAGLQPPSSVELTSLPADDVTDVEEEDEREKECGKRDNVEQPPSTIVQTERSPLTSDDAVKDGESVPETYSKKDVVKGDDARQVAETVDGIHGDDQWPTDNEKVVPSNFSKVDYVTDKDLVEIDGRHEAENVDDSQQLSDVIHAEVKPLCRDDVERDVSKRHETQGDTMSKDDKYGKDISEKGAAQEDTVIVAKREENVEQLQHLSEDDEKDVWKEDVAMSKDMEQKDKTEDDIKSQDAVAITKGYVDDAQDDVADSEQKLPDMADTQREIHMDVDVTGQEPVAMDTQQQQRQERRQKVMLTEENASSDRHDGDEHGVVKEPDARTTCTDLVRCEYCCCVVCGFHVGSAVL